MTFPYLIGVYQPSLAAAITFVNDRHLGDNVVQITEDRPTGYWLILRVTGDQSNAIREAGLKMQPRLSVMR